MVYRTAPFLITFNDPKPTFQGLDNIQRRNVSADARSFYDSKVLLLN